MASNKNMYVQHMAFKEIRVSKKRKVSYVFQIQNYRSLSLKKTKTTEFQTKVKH